MKKAERILYPIFFVAAAGLAYFLGFLVNETKGIVEARLEREAELRLLESPPVEVSFVEVKESVYIEKLTYTGSVIPWRSSKVAFAQSGKVSEILVDAGSEVKEGEILAELDTERIKTELEAAKADFKKALWDKKRIDALFKKGSASENDLKRVNLLLDLKRAEQKKAEKAYRDSFLKAPFSGIIAKRFVEKGEFALPQAPAFLLIDTTRVKVLVYVPESRITKVQEGNPAAISRIVEGGGAARFKGKVYRVYPQAENHLFPVEIEVENKEGNLKPGMVVDVEIQTGDSIEGFLLPFGSVLEEGEEKWVMVMEENAKIIDGYFDLGFLPRKRMLSALKNLGIPSGRKAWNEVESSLWKKCGLTWRERLKCAITYKEPSILEGPGIKVYHTGNAARKRVLEDARLMGNLWLVPKGKGLEPGEKLIVLGQHRVSDGTEVVVAKRSLMPVPSPGNGKEEKRK